MPYLVDGYNLLYAVGLVGRRIGPGSLDRARRALLNFLAAALDDSERVETTVVFDAKDPAPGRPRETEHDGITVRYADRREEADDLIEALIRRDAAPRRLVVISSDHRIQRAARRRKAKPLDSDAWWDELERRRRRQTQPPRRGKPDAPLSEEEVEAWLRVFEDPAQTDDSPPAPHPLDHAEPSRDDRAEPAKPMAQEDSDDPTDRRALDSDLDNPFPPGYGEDLLNGES